MDFLPARNFDHTRKQAQRICNRFGLRMRSNEKPGAHLPFSHPSLEAVRTYVTQQAEEKGIHPRLIANADQVWTLLFRPHRKTLQKPASAKGLAKDPLAKSKALRQIRHNIERALDMQLTEPDPGVPQRNKEIKPVEVTGGPAATAVVDEWRTPRTLTTLSFRDGFVGRAYLTMKSGTIPEDLRKKLNQELGKYIFIEKLQAKTHVWNQESLILYLDFLAEAGFQTSIHR